MEDSSPTKCETLVHTLTAEDNLLRKMADLQDPADSVKRDSASQDKQVNLSAQGLGASSTPYLDVQELLEHKTIRENRTPAHPHQSELFELNRTKTLSKSSTFPCPDEEQACRKSIKQEQDSSDVEEDQRIMKSAGPAYARSMSLPASVKPVPALKGGRDRNGESPKKDLHVKWAEEVYDPPCTSMSHTVKKHHQRRKAIKKEKERHKHRQNKSKSSRGTSIEKKNRGVKLFGNISGTTGARVQSTVDGSRLDKCGCSDVELLDYAAVGGQESKCGSNFMRESLAKMRISVAEAS